MTTATPAPSIGPVAPLRSGPARSAPLTTWILLQTDLRLGLDALRPMLIAVAGFVLLGGIATLLPASIVPRSVARFTPGDLLVATAGVLAVLSPVLSAWLAAAVLLGDRRHGASSLARTLPVRPGSRRLSRLLAMLPAALLPFLLVVLLRSVGFAIEPALRYGGDTAIPWMWTLAASLIGVVAVGHTATRRASMFASQVLAHGLTVAVVGVLIAGAWLGLRLGAGDISLVGDHLGGGAALQARAILEQAGILGVLIGLGLVVAIAGIGWVWALGAARPRTSERRRGLTAIVIGVLAAAIASPVLALSGNELLRWSGWHRRATLAATNEEIVTAIGRVMKEERLTYDDLDLKLWEEGRARLADLPPFERPRHPLWKAFVDAERYDTAARRQWSTSWAPHQTPAAEASYLRAIAAAPRDRLQLTRYRLTLPGNWMTPAVGSVWMDPVVSDAEVVAIGAHQRELLIGTSITDEERALRTTMLQRLQEAWPDAGWEAIDRAFAPRPGLMKAIPASPADGATPPDR